MTQNNDLWKALKAAGQLGYIIALPLVVFALFGRFLDKKFNSPPWLLLGGIVLAFLVSFYWVYKKMIKIIDKASEDENKKDISNS